MLQLMSALVVEARWGVKDEGEARCRCIDVLMCTISNNARNGTGA